MGLKSGINTITAATGTIEVDFEPIEIPGQHVVNGNIFPLVLKITKSDGSEVSLDETAQALRNLSERGITTDLLNKHGCVIFRGQPDSSPHAMSVLVHAAEEGRGHFPYDQIGLAGSRTVHDKEVFSASEAPPNLWIHQHNEYSRYTKFPSNIHFFCHKAPPKGGESPFAHSTELYERINQEMPEFVKDITEKGLDSPDVYRAPGKEGKNFIFTWAGPLAFGRDIEPQDSMEIKKKKAEEQARRLTPHFWWKEDDQLEVHQHVPAVRRHPFTKQPVWFNSLAGRYGTAYDRKATDPPYVGDDGMAFPPATYRDGSPIPKKYLHRTWEISHEIAVNVKTQPGDLALVDNYQVSHGRAPWFEGDRKILVSMWDTDKPEERILEF
ncbi:hypothetical protein LTR10_020889 [Elasticomyces elasticus]|uniref:TauD/TfdA-like domain-containing protein n=1 Tax=Exophiala sideris TaxID=1016849 RepID=A0ABR0IZL7_9EURO|nr:hypothetical protein LTR10_020889 [Elasticomyces elasticus]KAK5023398.1 hypothetical protein LTS07_009273 [Exophiala sideris]KAK5028226.1 hypothetical protein LTR13_009214 [Exophiala sideris]KAK5052884.1 hypothetical protein LTR69_009710 [Exophiala sideris]KAK5178495.1 hypothetical protein LTR44_009120 [Eurotiomycetes sp. CCFEE 6388]